MKRVNMSTDITKHGQHRSEEEHKSSVEALHANLFGNSDQEPQPQPHPQPQPQPHFVPQQPHTPAVNVLHTVKEVRRLSHEEDVNRLLDQGWVLLSVREGKEQTGQHDITPYVRFSVGRVS